MLGAIQVAVARSLSPWRSAEEAAIHCGVSKTTIWKLVRDGQLPSHRIPGTEVTRFAVSDLDAVFKKETTT